MRQAPIRLRLHCPHCPAHIDWTWRPEAGDALACPRCHSRIELNSAGSIGGGGRLEACVVCGSAELYQRKDFPQGLGLAVVLAAAALSFYFLTWAWFAAWGVLLAAVAIDVCLYFVVGVVTCCYRCRCEVRGLARDVRYGAFDLATAEKYL